MNAVLRVLYPCLLLALCSCTVGPEHRKPNVTELTPADWRWKLAEPKDAAPKGAWWKIFNDPVLDELETNAMARNQDLRAAVARVDEARAAARLSRSAFFPSLSLDPSFRRERTSGNLPTPIPIDVPSAHLDTFSVPFDLSYEIDLWGRIRRSFQAARAQAQASVSDYENAMLSLTADVAVNYFRLRSLDSELAMLRRTIELRDTQVRILQERFSAGTIQEIDVAQARTESASARAELADVERQRNEILHALALLCGKAASSFEVAACPVARHSNVASPLSGSAGILPAPVVPPGLPAELLERRPDIARAERNLAASSAKIGVARAAYFPALRLTGQAGYLSAEVEDLFSADSRVWSVGPGVSLPLFNAGRTAAEVKQAEAGYQAALANYRQTVLTAFREVEDSLVEITLREKQSVAQAEAVASAQRVAALAKARYEAGTADYLRLLDADRELLRHERTEKQLEGQRLSASVRLIKALGGGWDAD
jgi:multidrug efflux system outer membrane protein